MAARDPLSHDDYTVGWICALPLEMAAAKLMLDATHPSLPRPPTDQNTYILGNIGNHNIVIVCLPSGEYGNVSAATVAIQLLSSFQSIRFGLMVGIGGGVPSSNADIRLGDIVVSQPADTSGGVVQYDLGKALGGGQFQRTGMLNRPPKVLLTALVTLQAHHFTEDSRVLEFISDAQAKTTSRTAAANFERPTKEDLLYQIDYDHGASDTCVNCDRSKLTPRPPRDHKEPVIHYGLIASANQVVEDGTRRDQLARDLGVLCVEKEAAGLLNDFPCVVIRGICDYADSHKDKKWQGYAAAVAAAYAKELVLVVPIDQVKTTPTARDMHVDLRLVSDLYESATKKRNMNGDDSEGSTICSDISARKKPRLHFSGSSDPEESDSTDHDGNSISDESNQENAFNIPEPPDASQGTESYASVSERPTARDTTSEEGSSDWYESSPF
ncbi:unnamed protein product [Penicillium nalgiovense]|uniref:Nucleoside phosphorylase domain-containing protein n=1 Tax=Penicillium nalgiovense TaxID=60175 RepID=A0A9W4MS13_PENNA|nr:unnamed protein product [Penicillium nalgiovense]CAG7955518.1 unnamed protein product [Penicillium nalgiovense]CAG7958592.1 unnamed protein product [Penicillium nalgiovense]CAG7976972.1 unnamed protein product [Penicillium nalgiovense]CAG8006098.1 unnamed protein product [Penicillium nalgiovense]